MTLAIAIEHQLGFRLFAGEQPRLTQSSPVQSSPVQSSPVQSSPVQSWRYPTVSETRRLSVSIT
ncbi:MAG: hypothetical protein ACI9W2_001999, partial [Gammaproteobacteria bacterium]